jgi:hypothetical protein
MTQRFPLFTILAGLVTAAAWWVSRGVLDLVMLEQQTVRLALLPGWEALLGFLIAAVTLIGLVSVVAPTPADGRPLHTRWLPLLALAVLVLPYMPVVADVVTAFRLLAGPLREAVWALVVGVLAWSLLVSPSAHAWRPSPWTAWWPHAVTPLVVLSAAVAAHVGLPDGNLPPIPPREQVPALALVMVAAWCTWQAARQSTDDAGDAALATAAVLLSIPALQTMGMGGAPLAMMSLVATAAAARAPWLAGLACGLLTWVGPDAIPLAMVLLLGRVAGASVTARSHTPTPATLAALVLPFLGAIVLRASGLVALPGPWAQDVALPMTTSSVTWLAGLLGLLFDQRHGLLVWVPTLWVSVTGARVLWQRGVTARVHVITTVTAVVTLASICARHTEWWGGDRGPLWPLAAVLPLLAPVVAAGWSAAPPRSALRAMRHSLLWLGLWGSAVALGTDAMTMSLRGFPGLSPLLVWASPLNEAWRALPSFRHDAVTTALLQTGLWIAAAVVASRTLRRQRPAAPGVEAARALAAIAATMTVAGTAVALWPGDALRAGPTPLAQSRRASLDSFDPRARPMALLYTPLTRVAATDSLSMLALQVTPGLRTEPQPLRVLLNGRWALPAGEYRVRLEWTPAVWAAPEIVGLQVGRTGPPLMTRELAGDAGQADWDLSLPADAVFVGLRGSPILERALTRITVTPRSLVPAALRPAMPQVVGATRTPGGILLVHTDTAGIEADRGAWMMAGAPSLLSFPDRPGPAGRAPVAPLTLRLRSDAPTNRVTLTSRGWTQTVTLAAGVVTDVQVPRTGAPLTPVTIQAETAYTPAAHVPGSSDQRPLGVWITRPGPADTAVH